MKPVNLAFMKTQTASASRFHPFIFIILLAVVAGVMSLSLAHAGLTLDIRLIRDQQGAAYHFFTPLATNSILPAAPLGTYLINSPQQPTNGAWRRFELTAAGLNELGGGSSGYGDFASVLNQITNGNWTIVFTNATTTNLYQFTVSAPNVSSNLLPATMLTFPTESAINVTNRPTFTWQGPASWGVDIDAFVFTNGNFFEFARLAAAETAWTIPTPIPSGPDRLVFVRYITNYAAPLFVAGTPLNTISSQPLSGWDSTSALESHSSFVSFSVIAPPAGNPALFGHYTFDNEFDLKADSSGLGNHAVNTFFTGAGTQQPQYTAAGIAGGAVEFDGFNAFWWETDMVNVLSGSYTISLWLKTTQSFGSDTDDARDGAAIFNGDDSGDFPVPMALTGDKLGFHTADPDHTINSSTSINSGGFTHLVVTREAASGLKRIYVDGVLDTSGTGGTTPGIGSTEIYLGYSFYSGQGIEGVVDDLQVYTGVLNAAQIAFLFNNPGTTAPASSGGGHTNLAHYRFDDGGNLGLDDSGNDNNFSSDSSWGLPVHEFDQAGAVGVGGIRFYGVSSLVHAPPNPVFTNITAALADSFSLSLWVRTETVVGNDTDNAFDGAVVIWHFASNLDDNIPVSITGNKVAFHTGDELGIGQTLHSTSGVTDGLDHHIVVTRNRGTGEKKIYVDGVLEATETATTRALNGNTNFFSIGGIPDHSFDGTVDDVQIYSGVLSAGEVAGLFNNPGTVVPDTTVTTTTNPPVDVAMQISIVRNREITGNDQYLCFPKLDSVNIAEVTEHRIESPNNQFSGNLSGSSSFSLPSLGGLLNEATNGLWKLYINKNDPSEQLFTFAVTITGVDTNLLKAVAIFSPANGSTNVSTSPAFNWTGPVGFNGIFAQKSELPFNNVVSANLPGPATNWPSPPTLNPGTNRFYLSYHTNDVPHVTFSTPLDGSSQPINSFIGTAHLNSDATVQFVVTTGATPVQLLSPQQTGGNFQFQFLSQPGKTNTVQSRTNLTLGIWIDRTNILGDGSLKTVALPIGNAPSEFFRIATQ